MTIKKTVMAMSLLLASSLPALAFEMSDSSTHVLDRPVALDAKYAWPDAFVRVTVKDKDSISRAYLLAGGAEEDFLQKSSPWKAFLNQVVRANPGSFPASPRRERDFFLKPGDELFIPAIGRFALAAQGQPLQPPSVEQRLANAEANLTAFASASEAWGADLTAVKNEIAAARGDSESLAERFAAQETAVEALRRNADTKARVMGSIIRNQSTQQGTLDTLSAWQEVAVEAGAARDEAIAVNTAAVSIIGSELATKVSEDQMDTAISTALSALDIPEGVSEGRVREIVAELMPAPGATSVEVVAELTKDGGVIAALQGDITGLTQQINGDGTDANPGLVGDVAATKKVAEEAGGLGWLRWLTILGALFLSVTAIGVGLWNRLRGNTDVNIVKSEVADVKTMAAEAKSVAAAATVSAEEASKTAGAALVTATTAADEMVESTGNGVRFLKTTQLSSLNVGDSSTWELEVDGQPADLVFARKDNGYHLNLPRNADGTGESNPITNVEEDHVKALIRQAHKKVDDNGRHRLQYIVKGLKAA